MIPERFHEVAKLQERTLAFEAQSEHVGDVFTVRISLPDNYDNSDKIYPVLYVLDGGRSFGLAASTVNYLNLGAGFDMGKNVPKMIVVGIGYERGLFPWLTTRIRDLTPTEDAAFNYNNPSMQIPESGKAEKFLQFFRDELCPYLAENYRINASDTTLATHSMGGVFALYAMLRPDSLFQRYILSSPFVGWDQNVILQHEAAYAKDHTSLTAKVFFGLTGQEPTPEYIEEVKNCMARLEGRNYQNFKCTMTFYEDENHFSVWPKVLLDGLTYLFN